MAMTSTLCPVLGAHVARATDLEGHVTSVICVEFDALNGTCRLKTAARQGGPLSQLLDRMAENTLHTRSAVCELRAT